MSVDAYLLRDFNISFESDNWDEKVGFLTSQITIIPEHVSIVDSKALSWDFCHQLRQFLAGLDEDQRQLKCVLSCEDLSEKAKICLEGTWINRLVDAIGVSMKLRVALTEIKIYYGSPYTNTLKNGAFTTGMVPHYSCNDWVLTYESSLYNFPDNWSKVYGTSGKRLEVRGKLTITVSGLPYKALNKPLDMSATSIKAGQSNDWVLFSNRIFSEQLETDVEIVSANGSKHPCHKIFLTGNSPVFQAMFKEDSFKEGQTKSVALENMSEKGVVALLHYLYCIDSKDAEDGESEYDSDICMELLEASEEYSMNNLQKTIKRVFLGKPCEWFKVDTGLQLFCFARNAENCQELIAKSIQVLKSNKTQLKNSEDYKKLFKENPEAAMDLCNRLL